jgi:hypothetical protein
MGGMTRSLLIVLITNDLRRADKKTMHGTRQAGYLTALRLGFETLEMNREVGNSATLAREMQLHAAQSWD